MHTRHILQGEVLQTEGECIKYMTIVQDGVITLYVINI